MAQFFWVNQGGTHKSEVTAGCLWAPERDAHGATLNHWESMTNVQPGDIIFAYANGELRGYAIATSVAVPMPRPYLTGANYSPSQGGRILFCNYSVSGPSVPFATIVADSVLKAELSQGTNAVLNGVGTVAQKYLCPISALAGSKLVQLLGASIPLGAKGKPSTVLEKTTVQQLVDARVGQGKFREDLLAEFGGACPVTGLAERRLLRASHIRAWSESSNHDRLDPQNGVLLAAGVDAAFDAGFIGFDSSGQLLAKPGFSAGMMAALGIPAQAQIDQKYLTPGRLAQLSHHQLRHGL